MGLGVQALVCLLGTGSWVAINGVWVELPLMVASVPEGWLLPSCLTLLIQLANVGPLAFTLAHHFLSGRPGEVAVIYPLLCLGCLACLLLAFFWRETSLVGGSPRSVALLSLLFCLALVDCTSSVTFLPFMRRFRPPYLTTYFVGEGLSGLLPGLVALGQGVSTVHCHNGSRVGNATGKEGQEEGPRFSVSTFFLFLTGMMAVCLAAFLLLNYLPAAKREKAKEKYQARAQQRPEGMRVTVVEERPMMGAGGASNGVSFGSGAYTCTQLAYVFLLLAWVNALTNGVLPTIQSYSCLPYGNLAYHLSATLSALANPLACFLGMFLPSRSLGLMGALSLAGTLLACYILGVAALSPCPPLLHQQPLGAILIVMCWVFFVGLLSYVKLMIGMLLRDEGRSALVWCGAVVQLGSMLGALTMFPLVSIYHLFQSGDPCGTTCPD